MKAWLIDTGPLVAYLDACDSQHEVATACLDEFTGRLHTAAAVVTETMHLVGADPNGPKLLTEFLESSKTEVHECTKVSDLKRAAALMRKYRDTPMDFADATLILLGEELRTVDICTLDRRGFSIYRTSAGKRFNLLLG